MKTFPWLLLATIAITQSTHTAATSQIDCDNRSVCTNSDPNVCGSDGDTYVNKCTFESAYCDEPNELFFIVAEGPCVETTAASRPQAERTTESTPVPTAAPTTTKVKAKVKAKDKRPETATPVPTTMATPKTPIPTEHVEPYVEPPAEEEEVDVVEQTAIPEPAAATNAVKEATPAPVTEAEQENAIDMSNLYCQIKCALDGAPVCGTDGKPYINDCHLLAAKCKHPTLAKAYNGACVEGQSSTSASASSATTTVEVTASGTTVKAKCNPICARVYEPVCGSNSVTYANQCLLDYASCKNPRVSKFSDGKCAAKKKGKGCVPEICSSEEDYVCASNGESYLNSCMFDNAQCQFPELSILHEGECNEDTVLKCSTLTCPKYTECREDADLEVAYCADVCAAERCGEQEECQLLDAECFTAPCSPVAACVPIEVVS